MTTTTPELLGGLPTDYDILPGGIPRLIVRSKGVDYTIVNGAVAWQDGALTGSRAGKVLRT